MRHDLVLGDLCSDIVDCAHKTAPIDEAGEYFAVGTPAMKGNVIDYTAARRISATTFAAWTAKLRPRTGDLLLAREAPVGPVVRIPAPVNVAPGQRTVLLRPRKDVCDPGFLYYYLTSPAMQAELLVKASGSTVPHLNVADVRILPTPRVPPIAEQRAIAEVLGALDDKIAANQREIASAEELAVTVAGQADRHVKLSVLASQSTRSLRPSEFTERVSHFSLPAFDDEKLPEEVDRESIKSNKFLLDQPCVLMSKLNPRIPRIWNVGVLPTSQAVASTEFVVLRPSGFPATWLWAVLSAPEVSVQLQGLVAGTSGSHQRVRPGEMLDVEVADPRVLDESSKDSLTALGALSHGRRLETRMLAATRDELLPLVMSGRVRVKDAHDAVAEVL